MCQIWQSAEAHTLRKRITNLGWQHESSGNVRGELFCHGKQLPACGWQTIQQADRDRSRFAHMGGRLDYLSDGTIRQNKQDANKKGQCVPVRKPQRNVAYKVPSSRSQMLSGLTPPFQILVGSCVRTNHVIPRTLSRLSLFAGVRRVFGN